MECALVIMARYPESGAVKSRLAASVGAAAACDLYRAFLQDLDRRLRGGHWHLVWAVTPPGSRLHEVLPADGDRHYIDQRGAGLGERMATAFADLFAAGWRRVLMIGGDCPELDAAAVAAADSALADCDVVVAPTVDGGYALIGLAACRDVFAGVAMGTPQVMAQTRAACRRDGLRLRELPQWRDVDELADARALAAALAAGGARLPATEAVFAEWRRRGIL